MNKINFVKNSDNLYTVDLKYDEEGQYIYLAKHVHKWNYVLDNSDESGKTIKGYCSEEERNNLCNYCLLYTSTSLYALAIAIPLEAPIPLIIVLNTSIFTFQF